MTKEKKDKSYKKQVCSACVLEHIPLQSKNVDAVFLQPVHGPAGAKNDDMLKNQL